VTNAPRSALIQSPASAIYYPSRRQPSAAFTLVVEALRFKR
jgi:hypothetical protein